jgi:WD40 repeat protein
MALDEQGRTAAVGDSGRITIRDPAGAESQFAGRLEGTDTMTPLAFDRTGGHVAAVDPGGRVRVWNASGGQPEGGAVTGPVSPGVVRFLPDGRVVTCCSLGTGPARVRVWDRSGRERGTPPRVPGVTDVAVTPGGQLVTASGRGDQVTISGVGQPLHFRSDLLPTLSPDGLWASVSAKDGEEIWDLRRRHKTATLRDSVQAFSPAGPLVAVGSGPVVLYDRQTGRKRGSIGDADMELDSLAFSPDGRTLATLDTAGDQARLDLWDVERRRRLSEVPPFEGAVTFGELAFAPDGKKLALGTGEGAPLVFDLDADHWAARACELSPTCSGRPGQAGR